MDTGDARVGILSRVEARQKKMAGDAGHHTAGGDGGSGPIIKLRNNK